MSKAVIYARFSPRRNADTCESCETQIETCQAWCVFKKLEVIAVFRDEAVSGKTAKRPGLDQAIELVKAEKAVLVVHSLSRLARSVLLTLKIIDELSRAKVGFKSVKEEFDTSTPFGKSMLTFISAIYQLEREQIAERTAEAMRRHQSHGRRMSHHVPYGTQRDPRDPTRLIVNRLETGMIERAKVLRVQGFKLREIAVTLKKEGFKPRKVMKDGELVKGEFTVEKVRKILRAKPLYF